jgi:hypothetical protein
MLRKTLIQEMKSKEEMLYELSGIIPDNTYKALMSDDIPIISVKSLYDSKQNEIVIKKKRCIRSVINSLLHITDIKKEEIQMIEGIALNPSFSLRAPPHPFIRIDAFDSLRKLTLHLEETNKRLKQLENQLSIYKQLVTDFEKTLRGYNPTYIRQYYEKNPDKLLL